jgi:hypothetical protein
VSDELIETIENNFFAIKPIAFLNDEILSIKRRWYNRRWRWGWRRGWRVV